MLLLELARTISQNPMHATYETAPCATFIIRRRAAGGKTHHEPSSWRKKTIESAPDARNVSTRTQRHGFCLDRLNRVTRVRMADPAPNHFST